MKISYRIRIKISRLYHTSKLMIADFFFDNRLLIKTQTIQFSPKIIKFSNILQQYAKNRKNWSWRHFFYKNNFLRLKAAERTSGEGVTAWLCRRRGKVAGQLASCWDTLWLLSPVRPAAEEEYFGSVPEPLICFRIAKSFSMSSASCL